MPSMAQERRLGGIDAVNIMRTRPGTSLEEASAEAGTSPEAVQWFAGEALYRESGRWRVTRADRILRTMRVNSNGDVVLVDVRGSRKASELGAYHAAVYRYLHTGDDERLRRFTGNSVAGVPYETDTEVLEEMWRRGDLTVEEIYKLVGP